MKAALIGYGRWGKILEPYIWKYFKLVYAGGKTNIDKINADVFFIATPINTHYEIASQCLKTGRHVFLEKPMATKVKECDKLINLAEKKKAILYTDYLEMTAPSRLHMQLLLPKIGKIITITGRTLQKSPLTNIDWQLTCHQISMLSLFINLNNIKFTKCKSINTISLIMFHGEHQGILFSNIDYPEKIKEFVIEGTKGIIKYNMNKGIYLNDTLYLYDESNNIDHSIQNFITAIHTGYSPTMIPRKITEIISSF
jgi:predicted dehydrogenase